MMCSHRVAAVTLYATFLQCVMASGHFQLDISVAMINDPVNSCGIGRCDLFIEDMCLKPQPSEDQESGDVDEDCSLGEFSGNLDLERGLPKTISFVINTQPWPVDFQLYIDIKDKDVITSPDDVDELVIRESLNTSSTFGSAVGYVGSRVTLTLQFRVHCMGGYMGPHCDCLPRNDDENGHYSCREDGSISCLPGYTNTSDYCRQVPAPVNVCNCENGMSCIWEGGVHSCVCLGVVVGGKCSTPTATTVSTTTPIIATTTPVSIPRSQEEESSMSAAAIAGIVAGILLAVLLCGVLVVVTVYIQCRRKRQFDKRAKSQNSESDGAVRKVSESGSTHSKLVVNPTYGEVDVGISSSVTSTHSNGTLRHMQNPIYSVTVYDVENPLYKENPKVAANGDIYNDPDGVVPPSVGDGEGIYSSPGLPTPQGNGEGEYSYVTIGSNNTRGDNNAEYATPTVVPQTDDITYNTLNHAPQKQDRHSELAGRYTNS